MKERGRKAGRQAHVRSLLSTTSAYSGARERWELPEQQQKQVWQLQRRQQIK